MQGAQAVETRVGGERGQGGVRRQAPGQQGVQVGDERQRAVQAQAVQRGPETGQGGQGGGDGGRGGAAARGPGAVPGAATLPGVATVRPADGRPTG